MPALTIQPTLLDPVEGIYNARIVEAKDTDDQGYQLESKNGDPIIELWIEPQPGMRAVKDTMYFTDRAAAHNSNVIRAIGAKVTDGQVVIINAAIFLNRPCRVEVGKGKANAAGKSYMEIVKWLPPEAAPAPRPAPASAPLPAAPIRPAAPQRMAPGQASPLVDDIDGDDIPF